LSHIIVSNSEEGEAMKKTMMFPVIISLFFIVSGYGIAMGQTDSTKPSESQAATTEHTEHSGHEMTQPVDQGPVHAVHDMSQMSGMDDMKQQEEAMAAHMKNMKALMEKINTTENVAERKKLMAEHMAAMGTGMNMMREMDEKMMMAMMKAGKCPMMEMMSSPQGHAEMKGMMEDMPMCHKMMQKKADMNYSMMEQIIESQKQLLKFAQ
jgi:hypothetical protein